MSEQMKQKYQPTATDPHGIYGPNITPQPTVRAQDYIGGMRMLEAAERDYIRAVSGTPKIVGAAYANGAMTTGIGFIQQPPTLQSWQDHYLKLMKDEMLGRAMLDTLQYVIPDHMVPDWLRESKPVAKAEPAKPIGPRKPTPALPAESNTLFAKAPFDADRAHDALMALCRGG